MAVGDGPRVPSDCPIVSRADAPFALSRARALAATLADLDPAASPRARMLRPPASGFGLRVGVLPGSFDPLTTAHAALAAAALRHGPLDSLCYLLSVHTVDKVDRDQAALPDRR